MRRTRARSWSSSSTTRCRSAARSGPSSTCSSSAAPRTTRSPARCAGSPPRRRSKRPCSLPPLSEGPRRRPTSPSEELQMFVFKAAVVGAGTMGGEIAQVLASADVDVVLKDVEQKFIDTGLEKAKQVTEGQVGKLVKKEKITEDDGKEQIDAILGRITGTTEYEGFGDVDFVIEAVPERMKIKQSV